MTDALLKLVHRAIRGDRSALRALIERYQGFTYAHAFRFTKQFPQAQRVAQSAWPLAAAQLAALPEPERFPDLLVQAVERSFQREAKQASTKGEADEEHSILRTGKVQARRALRQALSDCPLAEAPVFFMRFVEGLSLDQIAELYGVEQPVAVESLRKVCVDLAFRSGFAGDDTTVPELESLSPTRRDALGFQVVVAEGSMAAESQTKMERLVQTNAECRKDHEAIQTVLSLATGTFSAHSLPPEFVREVLLAIPYAEPVRRVQPAGQAPGEPVPNVLQKPVPEGSALTVCLAGGLFSLLFLSWFLSWLIDRDWGYGISSAGIAGQTAGLILSLGCAVVAICMARPPVFAKFPRLPIWYYVLYGLTAGAVFSVAVMLLWIPTTTIMGAWRATMSVATPLICIAALALLGLRARLTITDLERRFELRLRRIEDAMPAAQPPPEQKPS